MGKQRKGRIILWICAVLMLCCSSSSWASTVAAGGDHTMAIKDDGSLWAWGDNGRHQLGIPESKESERYIVNPVQVGTAFNWQAVSAGGRHTLAVKADGTLWAWGNNSNGQLGNGSGSSEDEPVQITTDTDWKTVFTGFSYSFAVKNDGSLYAWGANHYGELGVGTNDDSNVPVKVSGDWSTVTGSQNMSFGIKYDGTLWAWGNNNGGYLGLGAEAHENDYNTPQQIGSDDDWQEVSVHYEHTLALKKDGSLWAWGSNEEGAFGNGQNENSNIPVKISTGWKKISAGDDFSAAIKSDGSLWAWGVNRAGQLGNGTTTQTNVPIQIGIATNWSVIVAGSEHIVSVQTDGSLFTWGNNSGSQLGNGLYADKSDPVQIGTGKDWKIVAGGDEFSFAATSEDLWAWGANWRGKLGDGTEDPKNVPVKVQTADAEWSLVSAGYDHVFAIKSDKKLWGWGQNYVGQLGLGDGAADNYNTPQQMGSVDWSSVAAEGNFTLAIRSDNGSLWAWGDNGDSQIGQGAGAQDNYNTPQQIGGVLGWKVVASGFHHSLAIDSLDHLWAWGDNYYGQLGNGSSGSGAEESSPVQIGTASWKAIAGGDKHTIAVQMNGTLWRWGTSTTVPTQIGTDADWALVTTGEEDSWILKADKTLYVQRGRLGIPEQVGTAEWASISAGGESTHILGIQTDGSLWAWGSNSNGQLGDGTAWNSVPEKILTSIMPEHSSASPWLLFLPAILNSANN